MLLWVSCLVLAPVWGQLATAPKPVISLHPPWTTAFRGETVNLTCDGLHLHTPEKTRWYQRWYPQEEILTRGNTLAVRRSGEYQCQTRGSSLSSPVRLMFSRETFILQAPHSVFEGDALVLRCQRRGKEKLTALTYTWNGKTLLDSNKSMDLCIPRASLNHSGTYQCTGSVDKRFPVKSNSKVIKIQELFPRPELKATASQPTEGRSVSLSCETRLPPERMDTLLHFIFFRDGRVVGSGWNRSSELQIPSIWRQDSGSYGCGAGAVARGVHKRSLPLQISVQGIPVSQVSMETQPPGDQAVEGEILVLVCSVAEGTGDTTFSWHREGTEESLGRKTLRSWRAELEIPVVKESHAGGYYCVADNGYGPLWSEVVNVTVTGTPGDRSSFAWVGVAAGSLGALLAAGLLFLCCHWRESGDSFQKEKTRSPPGPDPGESSLASCPAQAQQRLSPDSLHPQKGDLVYAEIQTLQLGEGSAAPCPSAAAAPRTAPEDQHPSVIYTEVKTQLPVNSAGEVNSKDRPR